MGTITFKPSVSPHRRADGTSTVRIRITANRKSKYISTNMSVSASQMTRSGNIRDRAVLDKIDELILKMRAAASRIPPFAVETMTIDEIARSIAARQDGAFTLDFFAFAETVMAAKASRSTQRYYRNAVEALKQFTGREHMDISEITSSMMRNFETWLVARHGRGARSTGSYPASIGHIHAQARLRYNNEETGEILIRNPFAYFHPARTRRPAHRNVSVQAVQALIDGRGMLTRDMDVRAVDMFLLSFALMGMNAIDMYRCGPEKDGVLVYNRAKTAERRDDRAEMHVLIDGRIRPLADRWADRTGERAFSFHRQVAEVTLRPSLSIGLRRACAIIGIAEPLTFYSARHTWATLAYSAGVDKSVINDCLCHVDASMRVTDIYIAKDWEVMWRANAKVLDLFRWPE